MSADYQKQPSYQALTQLHLFDTQGEPENASHALLRAAVADYGEQLVRLCGSISSSGNIDAFRAAADEVLVSLAVVDQLLRSLTK